MSESLVTLDAGFCGLRRPRQGLGLLGERRERRRLVDGHVGEHLAVERHAGRLEPADQLAVGEAVLARRGVDADDPQPPEVALLAPASDEART